MPKKHYEWSPGEQPPELSAHSIAKHDVLQAYLEKYVGILASNPFQDKLNLTLVDGFSGGGCYLHWATKARLPGSPIIMLEAMRNAEIQANQQRKKLFKLDVEYFFIDENKGAIDYLNNELLNSEAAHYYKNSTYVMCDLFSSQLDKIIENIKRRQRAGRSIFVLDQYGYTDVSMSDIRKIFKNLPKAEVILTIATDWLLDYWDDEIVKKIGLNLPQGLLGSIKEEDPANWRRSIQYRLHTEFSAKSGASYYTPFFIASPKASRCYWLLHFSAHPKAKDVMTELHWQLENHFEHYGEPGLFMLGYNPKRDNERLGYNQLPFGFDSYSAEISKESLTNQLPKVIAEFPDGIPFDQFFSRITNHMPATKSMLEEVLRGLTLEGQIEIFKDKRLRRSDVRINESDIIRVPKQKYFEF